jgi:hypothetical protein
MTVIDYRPIEQQGIERAKTCEEGNQQCRQNAGIMGPGYWRHDDAGPSCTRRSNSFRRPQSHQPRLGMAGHGRRQFPPADQPR